MKRVEVPTDDPYHLTIRLSPDEVDALYDVLSASYDNADMPDAAADLHELLRRKRMANGLRRACCGKRFPPEHPGCTCAEVARLKTAVQDIKELFECPAARLTATHIQTHESLSRDLSLAHKVYVSQCSAIHRYESAYAPDED